MWTRDLKASRRTFLRGGVAGAALTTLAIPMHAQEQPIALDQYAPEFFTSAEWAFVMAATARLIPSDGDGPGAIEARVPVFIDRQMAGDFGVAADWYMEGPHEPDADPKLGFQSPLSPAEVCRAGIEAFDIWCTAEHGRVFAELIPDIQDTALTKLEAGETGLPPELRDFFSKAAA
ncbi:MAG: gluconate 2-dehydrogenase subunit 3 family protein [Roseovarius sp.]|jgi:gluconate 2-dehydrogenase gamma chain|nr:gluconate 2-dehydrogenase subunit 3 family protein [Roseovarius sp.]